MSLRILFALFLALLGAPALGQQADAPSDPWVRGDGRVANNAAKISFPTRAGGVSLLRTAEFSRQGEGLDTGLQYATDDQQVFATVYLYYPGLPHAGVTAYATDHAIELQSPSLQRLRREVVAAGGRQGAAIRVDYAGYRDGLASSAAFVKSGRWILKLRVSGPEARRAEVERAMAALLDGIRFEGEAAPWPTEPLDVSACPDRYANAASFVPSIAADAMEEAVIGVLDGSGDTGREAQSDQSAATPLIGPDWCVSTRARVGELVIPILRSKRDGRPAGGLRSTALAIVTDSGMLLEVVHNSNRGRHIVLWHQIGETRLLGAFDGPPSDEQIVAIISGADRVGSQVRATIAHKIDGNTDITLHVAPDTPAQPTT